MSNQACVVCSCGNVSLHLGSSYYNLQRPVSFQGGPQSPNTSFSAHCRSQIGLAGVVVRVKAPLPLVRETEVLAAHEPELPHVASIPNSPGKLVECSLCGVGVGVVVNSSGACFLGSPEDIKATSAASHFSRSQRGGGLGEYVSPVYGVAIPTRAAMESTPLTGEAKHSEVFLALGEISKQQIQQQAAKAAARIKKFEAEQRAALASFTENARNEQLFLFQSWVRSQEGNSAPNRHRSPTVSRSHTPLISSPPLGAATSWGRAPDTGGLIGSPPSMGSPRKENTASFPPKLSSMFSALALSLTSPPVSVLPMAVDPPLPRSSSPEPKVMEPKPEPVEIPSTPVNKPITPEPTPEPTPKVTTTKMGPKDTEEEVEPIAEKVVAEAKVAEDNSPSSESSSEAVEVEEVVVGNEEIEMSPHDLLASLSVNPSPTESAAAQGDVGGDVFDDLWDAVGEDDQDNQEAEDDPFAGMGAFDSTSNLAPSPLVVPSSSATMGGVDMPPASFDDRSESDDLIESVRDVGLDEYIAQMSSFKAEGAISGGGAMIMNNNPSAIPPPSDVASIVGSLGFPQSLPVTIGGDPFRQ